MANGPSQDDILSALKNSGYLMEQEVASKFEALEYHVQTNRAFEDADEGKSREIDVQAIKRVANNEDKKLAAYVEIVAECKNSANPLVFVGRPKNQADKNSAPEEFVFPVKNYVFTRNIEGNRVERTTKQAFYHLGFDAVHYHSASPSKAVQFCRIDRNGKGWHANHGGLYDAIFYPMAKAVTARRRKIPQNRQQDSWKYFWLFFPTVVVSSQIFYVDSSKNDPKPEERDYVSFRREIKSQTLDGTFILDFVRAERLDKFVAEVINPVAERAKALVENEPDRVLKGELSWQ